MNDLRSNIMNIQRLVGAEVDGVFGPDSANRVLAALREDKAAPEPVPASGVFDDLAGIDERSEKVLLTLDAKAILKFAKFLRLAKATAATLGCDYILISGNRTWAQQDALYAQGRNGDTRPIVTNAKGGQSNHNFGIAVDAGVFRGKVYLDGGTREEQALAAKVHKACSEHAKACGLEWGGSWTSIKDLPHYEVATGLSMPAKRKLYSEKGSVL